MTSSDSSVQMTSTYMTGILWQVSIEKVWVDITRKSFLFTAKLKGEEICMQSTECCSLHLFHSPRKFMLIYRIYAYSENFIRYKTHIYTCEWLNIIQGICIHINVGIWLMLIHRFTHVKISDSWHLNRLLVTLWPPVMMINIWKGGFVCNQKNDAVLHLSQEVMY